ncbi:Shugoshin [Fulvia fulva]|uniref:Shugoshin n=1 Tax=Passalora fulva TaxID=5499 RepID=A0A9Q8PLD3_PASFU|nr:Shugoshin [Fulvia fulva]KAK4610653.1 Shugoshin [Fulvia fulva]KAK4610880.1 Shugoshin [Fulvia fulva]UJO24603.1 Shugoshin [Fulvia fulva]WPV21881.1 Shugoshin [Fulvia fulva]WPV36655.1 Shugoshin [Fulvia fulva]
MARLNEPPVAPAPNNATVTGTAATGTESLDALKRRFIRQNRELAKNNSSQSLRIRSLELEVSKLLGDNLDLREQVLSLQNEVHSARRQAGSEAMRRMKSDLQMKLAELSGLVEGFGAEEEDERPVVQKERILSPSQRQYRERQPLAELMQDAVMPTIVEDKHFPRRTLDPEEIRSIRLSDQSASTGSPDLGPPPVAHFEFGSSQETNSQEDVARSPLQDPRTVDEQEELLPSINLETRRKRKSTSKIEIRRHSILAQSPVKEGTDAATTMLRTGAKRKLGDRETDKPFKPPSSDDFTFSRRASAVQPSSDEEKAPSKEDKPVEETLVEIAKPTRRVLGEKSVNMSPRKAEVRAGKPLRDDLKKVAPPKLKSSKDSSSAERPPARGRRVSSIPLPSPQDDVPATIELPPPEASTAEQLMTDTPAAHDLFSPTSEASAKEGARDTPPPENLSSAINTTEGGPRPSRRARPALSYKEPSLAAKMRRPGKEMVDAISGLQDPRRVMSLSHRSSSGPLSTSEILIKTEPEDDDAAWKTIPTANGSTEPASPLREKSTNDHLVPATDAKEERISTNRPSQSASVLSSVTATSRNRREQLDRRESQPFGPNVDAAQTTKTSRRTSPEATKDSPDVEATAKKLEELDIYDFKDSSSPATDTSTTTSSTSTSGRKGSRRHSSVPKQAEVLVVPAAAPIATPGERVSSRRRSMML